MIKTRITITMLLLALAGCSGKEGLERTEIETTTDGTSKADSIGEYKVALANRIVQVNSTKVYIGRPQALLRSVVVVKYTVDANGSLVRSEILRSNRDRTTEATALSTLRNTAPFPKPASSLLKNGRVELMETWLFNNDGRFQLRTIAEPQMDE
ncbi:MAG: TonB family protein [Herminiimonas sp.]|uniref:energy transducer TonB family protein n=1 Tax=Herminiimonas sp. TaxID=1926289 RepID=UPI002720870A|nr:TonB family protein [Herminiimonas sp.]MDO9420146.1 TonB family protein [Herminiimonas sp.]